MINKNPFSNNRAEYMEDVWKFYVPFSDLNMDNAKPLVIEGGRGTGKTMFFLCNSWRAMQSKHAEECPTPINKIIQEKYIGLYYKVDPSFVAAMHENGRKLADWEGVFGTYLSTVLAKELIGFLIEAQKEQLVVKDYEKQISNKYSTIFRGRSGVFNSFGEVIDDIDNVLNDIEDIVNNPEEQVNKFRKTMVGSALARLIEEMKKSEKYNALGYLDLTAYHA